MNNPYRVKGLFELNGVDGAIHESALKNLFEGVWKVGIAKYKAKESRG